MSKQLVLLLQTRVVYGLFDDLTEAEITTLTKELRQRLRDIIGNASGNGLITDDLATVLEHLTIRVENEDELGGEGVERALVALCNETDTFPGDWDQCAGPESGCGDDYYYENKEGRPDAYYWVNIDQSAVKVERCDDLEDVDE